MSPAIASSRSTPGLVSFPRPWLAQYPLSLDFTIINIYRGFPGIRKGNQTEIHCAMSKNQGIKDAALSSVSDLRTVVSRITCFFRRN